MSEQKPKKYLQGKTRIWIAILAVVVVVLAVAMTWSHISKKHAFRSSADISSTPNIESLPGAGDPSDAYVKAQNDQNVAKAEEARKTGGSNVPTFTRPSFQGFLDDDENTNKKQLLPDVSPPTSSSACPINKVVYMYKPNPANCDLNQLVRAHEAGVSAEELICQSCSCSSLLAAGYTAGELKAVGFTATDLRKCGASLEDLKKAGFTAAELKAAGFTADELKKAGFTAAQLASAGFTDKELKDAGFTDGQLAAAGIGVAENAKKPTIDCSPEALRQQRLKGVSARVLKEGGCDLSDLKAAGYTAAELKQAGFNAAELKRAGFSAAELKAAGFSAKDLKEAGFTAAELKNAGFSAADLKNAGFNAGDLRAAGFSAQDLKDAGFGAQELRAAGFSAADLKDVGFDPERLAQAGYTKGDLLRAGFTPEQAGYIEKKPPPKSETNASDSGTDSDSFDNPFSQFADGDSSSLRQRQNGIPSVNARAQKLRDIQNTEADLFNQEQRRALLQQIQQGMTNQANSLLKEWTNPATQIYQEGAVEAEKPDASANSADVKASGPIIKAGTVYFAVLDTGLNSDEPSPILATVVTGPLKGAKVIGKFELAGQKVVLHFNVMNVPQFEHTFSIDTVAIDQNTARTALAENVNTHFLLRYGSLLAASFLSGVSDGVLASTQDTWSFGPLHGSTTKGNLSLGQYALLGLGKAGQKYSDQVGDKFNLPPTVTVGAGAGIGLLFLSDVQLSENLPKAQTKT